MPSNSTQGRDMRNMVVRTLLLTVLIPCVLSVAWAANAKGTGSESGGDWKARAAGLAPGDSMNLEGVVHGGEPDRAAETLVLTRFSPVTPDARLRVNNESMPLLDILPQRTYFQGHLADEPGSRATVILDDSGWTRGLVFAGERIMALGETDTGSLVLTRVDQEDRPAGFSCGNETLAPTPQSMRQDGEPGSVVAGIPDEGWLARVAVETDFEYFQKFGNVPDATVYAMDLVAFASTLYSEEVETAMAMSSLSLWTDSNDPWDQSSTGCLLYEFGQYWNDNNDDIDRTIAHLLSGRSSNSGIAWVGVLCSGGFPTQVSGCPGIPDGTGNYGGAYGVTSGLDANFDLQNPQSVWDIVAFTHEVGHNFNSPHTHCYNGLGGSSEPIDQCFNGQSDQGCYAGTQQLPGPAGQGSGTLMSYCHLLSPGLSNISLTLGSDHPFGVLPERVPDRMLSHVMDRASIFPECLSAEVELIFGDGFEVAAIN